MTLTWEHTQTAPSTWRAESGPFLAIVRRARTESGSYWSARVERHDPQPGFDLAELTPVAVSDTALMMRCDAARAWCESTINEWVEP